MPIKYTKNTARFIDTVGVEDAEGLLEWLQRQQKPKVNFSACSHLHAANLQVLMAAKPVVAAWPEDAEFAAWLQGALGRN
jgi:hypothetical protein